MSTKVSLSSSARLCLTHRGTTMPSKVCDEARISKDLHPPRVDGNCPLFEDDFLLVGLPAGGGVVEDCAIVVEDYHL